MIFENMYSRSKLIKDLKNSVDLLFKIHKNFQSKKKVIKTFKIKTYLLAIKKIYWSDFKKMLGEILLFATFWKFFIRIYECDCEIKSRIFVFKLIHKKYCENNYS
jgi:hypothetical protein